MSNPEAATGLKIDLVFKKEVSPAKWVKTALQVRSQYTASFLRGETVADVDAKLLDEEVEERRELQLDRIPNLSNFDPEQKLPARTPLRVYFPESADPGIVEEVFNLYKPKE